MDKTGEGKFKKFNKFKGHGKKHNPKSNTQKRFLKNAKGFAKKGYFGRGTNIEEEKYQYFLKILEELRKPAESADERVCMSTNVLNETKNQEVHFASNQVVSRVLETIIGFAEEERFARFIDVFGANVRQVCSNPYASHVLQKVIEVAFLRAVGENKIGDHEGDEGIQTKKIRPNIVNEYKYNTETMFSTKHKEKCAEFVERVSKFLLNNLEVFVSDMFANHVIRTCLNCLAGIWFPKNNEDKPNMTNASKNKSLYQTSEAWEEILKEFPTRLEMWPQFSELAYKDLTAAFFGTICKCLAQKDKSALMSFGKKLIEAFQNEEIANKAKEKEQQHKNYEDENEEQQNWTADDENEVKAEKGFAPVFACSSSSFLLEEMLITADPELFKKIYEAFFEGRIVKMAKTKACSFAVNKLLSCIEDKALFEKIFDECLKHFEEFLKAGNFSIFSVLSGTCLRLDTKQAAFLTGLQEALHCSISNGPDRPKSFLTCVLKLKQFEDLSDQEEEYVTPVGAYVVRNILQFKKPIFLVSCILDAYPKDLSNVFQTPFGSYIADTFLLSKSIGEKSREKFIRLFDGFYEDLAVSRFGSHVLEKMFDKANEVQKVRIAKELTSKQNKLKGVMYGRIMYNKFRLETFKLSTDQWKASWNATDKKQTAIDEIINKNEAPKEEVKHIPEENEDNLTETVEGEEKSTSAEMGDDTNKNEDTKAQVTTKNEKKATNNENTPKKVVPKKKETAKSTGKGAGLKRKK